MARDLEGSDEPGAATNEPADASDDQEFVDPGHDADQGAETDARRGAEQDSLDSPEPDAEPPDDAESVAEPSESEPVVEADHAGEDIEPEPPIAEPEPPVHVPAFTRFRVWTFLAVGPLVTSYVAIAGLLAIVTGIASNAQFTATGVLLAAMPGWLAAYQVPIEIFGLELGILPLLPTIGVAALTARAAARAAERLDLRRPAQAGFVIGVVACAHAVAGLVLAGLSADKAVTANPLSALYYPALVAALAATAGVARRCGLLAAVVRSADAVAVAGLRAGALAVVLLLTAGGAVLTFGLLTSIATARDLFPMGVGNAVGMLLLSIGYVPNAMVAATSFIAGPGFSLGTVDVAPLEFHGGRLPGVPLLAALPEQQHAWWPALFVLPLVVGIVVGRRLRHVDEDPVARLRGVAVATGVVAVCFVVLAGSAGGRLGRGTFDPVSMRAVALSIALVLWTVIPGAITAWFGGPRAMDPMPGLIEDDEEPDDELTDEHDEHDHDEQDEDEPEHDLPGPRDAVEESGEVARD